MSDWQPIDTAPKDGASVLIYDRHDGVLRARWSRKRWVIEFAEGQAAYDASEATIESYAPTHWMPVPNPPKETIP